MDKSQTSLSGDAPPSEGKRLKKSLALFALGLMVQAAILGLAMKGKAQYDRQADVQILEVKKLAGGITDTIHVTYENAGPDSADVSSFLVAYSYFDSCRLTILSCDTNLGTVTLHSDVEVEVCSADHGNVPPGVTVTNRAVVLAIPCAYDWEFGAYPSGASDPDYGNNYGSEQTIIEPREPDPEPGEPSVDIGIVGVPVTTTVGASISTIITFTSTVTLTTEVIASVSLDPPGIIVCNEYLPTSGTAQQSGSSDGLSLYWMTGLLVPGETASLGGSCIISDTGSVLLVADLLTVLPPPLMPPNAARAEIAVLGLLGESIVPPRATQGMVYTDTLRMQSVDDEPISNLLVRAVLTPSPENGANYEGVIAETGDPESSANCEILSPNEWLCHIDQLAASGVITVTTQVLPTAAGHNIQRIDVAQNDTELLRFNDATTVEGGPELRLGKSDGDLTTVVPGGPITYTLTVDNVGEQAATSVVITDTLPAFTSPDLTVSTDGWACEQGNEETNCTFLLPSLFAGGTYTLTLVADVAPRLPAGLTAITNTAFVAAENTGPEAAVGQAVTPLAPPPDLQLVKAAAVDAVVPGGAITYTLEVANVGDGDATGVVITDTLPVHTVPINATGWECGQGAVGATCTFPISRVDAGAILTATLVAGVVSTLPPGVSEITNTAFVADDSGRDPTPDNSTSSASTRVEADQKIPCDASGDGIIDRSDILMMVSVYRNSPAGVCPACDIDGDGTITVLDARKCVLECTLPRCATVE